LPWPWRAPVQAMMRPVQRQQALRALPGRRRPARQQASKVPTARCPTRLAQSSARGRSRRGTRANSGPPRRDPRGTCGTSPRPAIRSGRMVNAYCSQQLLASIPLFQSAIPRLPLSPSGSFGSSRGVGVSDLRRADDYRPIKANPLLTIRHVTSHRLGLLPRRRQGASAAVGSRSSAPGQRAGGLPKALRALFTIFLPASRLPTAPTPAPIPTGSILPNTSALRRSV
jgi:hypothetical protein